MKKQTKEDPLYVGIPQASEVQKSLLESSKDLLLILKQSETVASIREDKKEKIESMNKLLKEMRTQLNKLKRTIPHIVAKTEAAPIAEVKKAPSRKVSVPKSEVQKIEDELAFIESRLNGL